MAETISKFANELRSIRKDLSFLKKHMVDIDSIMTEEDFLALQDYRKDKKEGKLLSHEQLKKQLGS